MRASARYQLKHDKFAATVAGTAVDTYSWASEHRTRTVAAAAAFVVVLAAVLGLWFWNQQQSDKANLAFGHAMRVYDATIRTPGTPAEPDVLTFGSAAERAQAAQKQFADIAEKYPHTNAGHIARYFVGITLKDAGNYPAAEKQLQEVASGGGKDLAALAHYALASMYAATNRPGDAVKQYKELIDHPANTVARSTAQLELASLYEDTQQPAEAAKLYEQIKKDDPKGPAAQYAQSKLTSLGKPAGQ